MAIDQVLPDRHGVAAARQRLSISSRYGSHALALGARPGRTAVRSVDTSWRMAGFGGAAVGGHQEEMAGFPGRSRWTPRRRNGRFCLRFAAPSWPAHGDSGGFQIAARRSRVGRRWCARCAAATSPVARALQLDVVCRRPRRCSCGVGTSRSPPASTSRAATRNGRFSGVHQWPVLGVHRGDEEREYPKRAIHILKAMPEASVTLRPLQERRFCGSVLPPRSVSRYGRH